MSYLFQLHMGDKAETHESAQNKMEENKYTTYIIYVLAGTESEGVWGVIGGYNCDDYSSCNITFY